MSSFICEKCGKEIIDSENGYKTYCKHYPKETVKIPTLKEILETKGIDPEILKQVAKKD